MGKEAGKADYNGAEMPLVESPCSGEPLEFLTMGKVWRGWLLKRFLLPQGMAGWSGVRWGKVGNLEARQKTVISFCRCQAVEKHMLDLHGEFCENIDSGALFPHVCFSGPRMGLEPVFLEDTPGNFGGVMVDYSIMMLEQLASYPGKKSSFIFTSLLSQR